MGPKLMLAAAVVALYLIYGIMMLFMLPGSGIDTVLFGPAKIFWNLFLAGFFGEVPM